jgi:radical SAM superfamily enzyme YgiQ (UPF0313 family)
MRRDVTIVFGGPFSQLCADDSLRKFPEIDCVVLGEGEKTFLEMLRALENNLPLAQVEGIVFREGDRVVATLPRSVITDLDSLPLPAYRLIDLRGSSGSPLDAYRSANRQVLKTEYPIKTLVDDGRGCPQRCSYCTEPLVWGPVRRRSPASIVNEIQWLQCAYGVEVVEFTHDNFTARRTDVVALCDAFLQSELDVNWVCRARLDKVDNSLLEKMSTAGCSEIVYGVESFSLDSLARLRKDMPRPEVLPDRIRETVAHGIVPHLSFIVGLPEERPEQLEVTLRTVTELVAQTDGKAVPYLHLLCLLPRTELWLSSRHRLELRLTPDFCEGVAFDDEHMLPDDLDLICSDPGMFSSFYDVRTTHIPIDTIYVIHKCVPQLLRRNPNILLGLSVFGDHAILDFFNGFAEWIGERLGDVGQLRLLAEPDVFALIAEYNTVFCSFQLFGG